MQHHIVSVKLYLGIFATLMVLTVLTVAVAFVDMGFLNTVVAMTIAVIKALLVVLVFMHLKYSARILWLTAGAGAFWFLIMVALTLSDYRSRDWLTQPEPWDTPPPATSSAQTPHG